MLGLRFFVCLECRTVSAEPEPPTACGACGSTRFEELTDEPQANEYFSRAADDDR